MNEITRVTAGALNPNDNRVNFNFFSETLPESWCLSPLKDMKFSNPSINQQVTIYGHWVNDASGSRVFFQAINIEY